MKKSLSIFLFSCFVLYHFGYYAFYFSYNQHLESKWKDVIYGERSIEAVEELIEIPLTMPYMANQEEFQATNTSYENNGSYYRVIKQRYQNDTLQLIVLPDSERLVLKNTLKKWISVVTEDELPQDEDSSFQNIFFVKDYIQPVPFCFKAFVNKKLNSDIGFVAYFYLNPIHSIHSPPPLFS